MVALESQGVTTLPHVPETLSFTMSVYPVEQGGCRLEGANRPQRGTQVSVTPGQQLRLTCTIPSLCPAQHPVQQGIAICKVH